MNHEMAIRRLNGFHEFVRKSLHTHTVLNLVVNHNISFVEVNRKNRLNINVASAFFSVIM